MANNLKKFNTAADYSAATLNYPAVSWVVSGDSVHYAKEAPPAPSNDKMMMYFNAEGSHGAHLWNCEASTIEDTVDSVLFNNVEADLSCNTHLNSVVGDNLAVYTFKDGTDSIEDWFSGELGEGSDIPSLEILVPAQITEIHTFPNNSITALVVESTTPPYFEGMYSVLSGTLEAIYVPDEAVGTYEEATDWNQFPIYGISDYSGNLPINS